MVVGHRFVGVERFARYDVVGRRAVEFFGVANRRVKPLALFRDYVQENRARRAFAIVEIAFE